MLIFGCFGFVLSLHGQAFIYKPGVSSPLVDFHFTIPDTSNNGIFRDHPEIGSIRVWFNDNNPEFVFINDVPNDPSFYEMNFQGDALALNKKYGPIRFIAPRVSSTRLYGREKLDFPAHWAISTSIYRDSVVYFSQYRSGEKPHLPIYGFAARFIGKYENLAQQIADELRREKLTAALDSVIVLQGLVEKKRSAPLKDLKLIVGTPTAFSDIALRVMGDERNEWGAATYASGVMGTSAIKFYIQLNPDGSVEIEAPTYMDARISKN